MIRAMFFVALGVFSANPSFAVSRPFGAILAKAREGVKLYARCMEPNCRNPGIIKEIGSFELVLKSVVSEQMLAEMLVTLENNLRCSGWPDEAEIRRARESLTALMTMGNYEEYRLSIGTFDAIEAVLAE